MERSYPETQVQRIVIAAVMVLAVSCATPSLPRRATGRADFTCSDDAAGAAGAAGATTCTDGTTGRVWYAAQSGTFTWAEAKEHCAAQGLVVPSVDDFEDAAARGLATASPHTMNGYWYWTSSASSSMSFGLLARAYQGVPHGYVVNLSVDDRISVRCISPAS